MEIAAPKDRGGGCSMTLEKNLVPSSKLSSSKGLIRSSDSNEPQCRASVLTKFGHLSELVHTEGMFLLIASGSTGPIWLVMDG
jgi:hypothetical protein